MDFETLNLKCQNRLAKLFNYRTAVEEQLTPEDLEKFNALMDSIDRILDVQVIEYSTITNLRKALGNLKTFVEELDEDTRKEIFSIHKDVRSAYGGLGFTDSTLNNVALDLQAADRIDVPAFLENDNPLLTGDPDPAPVGTEIYVPDEFFEPNGEIGRADPDREALRGRPLFPEGGPGADDVIQTEDHACFLLANLVGIAGSNPDVIRNLLTDHGDGTVTVHLSALRGEQKVPLNVRVDKTVGALDSDSANWVKYVEKALAASHVLQTGGSYPEGLRAAVEKKTLPRFSLRGNLDGGAPELAINVLTRGEANDTVLNQDLMLAGSFDDVKNTLMEKLRFTLANGGSVFMYSGKHVVSISAAETENGRNVIRILDQSGWHNGEGRRKEVTLEEILSGKALSHGRPFEKLQMNFPDRNAERFNSESVFLINLESKYDRFPRPAKEEAKEEPVVPRERPEARQPEPVRIPEPAAPKKEPPLINSDDDEPQAIVPENRPKLIDPYDDEPEVIAPENRPKLIDPYDDEPQVIVPENRPKLIDPYDDEPQVIAPEAAPDGRPQRRLPDAVIVERIARLNREMQATATFSPRTSAAMMDAFAKFSDHVQANKNDPGAIADVFNSPQFLRLADEAGKYVLRCDEASKNGTVLNARQLTKIKVCNKLAGLISAVESGKDLTEYKNRMLAEKLMIQNGILSYQRAPREGLGLLANTGALRQATEKLVASASYKAFLRKANVAPDGSGPNMDKLIRIPGAKLFKAFAPKPEKVTEAIREEPRIL